MKKAKHKLYSGHGIVLEKSPNSEDDFENISSKSRAKAESSTTSALSTGRKKKEGRLSRKSSTKRKLLQGLSLSFQSGTRNDVDDGDGAPESMQQGKSGRSGIKSGDGTESANTCTHRRKQEDKGIESTQGNVVQSHSQMGKFTGRKKKEGKFSRKSSKSRDGAESANTHDRQQEDDDIESTRSNLVQSDASDYDFSLLLEVPSQQILRHQRNISGHSDLIDHSMNEDWVTKVDKEARLRDPAEFSEAPSGVLEQPQVVVNQPDEGTDSLETQNIFITQKDPKHKHERLERPFGTSRNLRAECMTGRVKPANRQHHTVSQIKPLKRGTITQALMVRHSGCPQHFLIPPSQHKNKSGARTKLFLGKVKKLQEKRKIQVDSQMFTLEESLRDSQLTQVGELPVSPEDHGSDTQMFDVSSRDQEPVVTESQSLIPPMVPDDDSEEDPDKDTFKEVLSMRLASRKQRKKHKNSGMFGWSPLEEAQGNEIDDSQCDERRYEEEDGDKDGPTRGQTGILDENVSLQEKENVIELLSSEEETVDGNLPECSSQLNLGKDMADLSQTPSVKQGMIPVAEGDLDFPGADTFKEDCTSVAPLSGSFHCKTSKNGKHPIGEAAMGPLSSIKKSDTVGVRGTDPFSVATTTNIGGDSMRVKDVIVLETQSERTEAGEGRGEISTQNHDVTIVPDSHDLSQSSLPGYHFTSDEESSDELHDESVTHAVSKFLTTFEDVGDEEPPWEKSKGQSRRNGASEEKKEDSRGETLKGKGAELVEDSQQHISGSDKREHNFLKVFDKNANICIIEEEGDDHLDDMKKLEMLNLHSGPGPVIRNTKKANMRLTENVVSHTSSSSTEFLKKLSRRLAVSEDRKGSVTVEKDQNTDFSKKATKLPERTSVVSVRADAYAVDGSGSITSTPIKKHSFFSNSSQSPNNVEVVCPPVKLSGGSGKGSVFDAADVSTGQGDSSQETCLPEDDDNGTSDAQRFSSESSSNEGGELEERKMLVGEVSSSVGTVCEAASSSSQIAGRMLETSMRGEGLKSDRLEMKASSTQTDITLEDLQSQEYFDFCMEFKRLLLEYEKSIISTSGSGSFGSSTSDSESRDYHKAEDLMGLVKKVYNSTVKDKLLSSDEATSERSKWRKRRKKMVDSSCQTTGSPSPGLEKSPSQMNSSKNSTKEDLSENWVGQGEAEEGTGGLNAECIKEGGNFPLDLNDVSEILTAQNDLEGQEVIEEMKTKNRKKRKESKNMENLHKTKTKKRGIPTAENHSERKEILKEGETKKGKKRKKTGDVENEGKRKKKKKEKENPCPENYFEEREIKKKGKTKKGKKKGDLEKLTTRKENVNPTALTSVEEKEEEFAGKSKEKKKTEDLEYPGKNKKKAKATKNKEKLRLLDIPVESLPSPRELTKQWKAKRKKLKKLRKTLKEVEFTVQDEKLSSLGSGSSSEVTGLETLLVKKKKKLRKKQKESKKMKVSGKQELLKSDSSLSDGKRKPERSKKERRESRKRKKDHKVQKKKVTFDDQRDQLPQEKSAALTSGLAVTTLQQEQNF